MNTVFNGRIRVKAITSKFKKSVTISVTKITTFCSGATPEKGVVA